MLSAEHLTVRYDRHGPAAVQGLSVTVPREAAIGLAGPSGCDKSTLARVLGLALTPHSGTVHLDGAEVTAWRYRAPSPYAPRSG